LWPRRDGFDSDWRGRGAKLFNNAATIVEPCVGALPHFTGMMIFNGLDGMAY
jgi:hypothetical protein